MWGERLTAAAIGVAVFLAGAALLSLEIASSRVMAPYFGNSLFVWGALIGVVLAGLSLGYWIGGTVADRMATPRFFVGILVFSALLVLAIPFVDGWLLEQVVRWNPGPRLNPVVATIAIFGLPAIVLGTVSPVAVKLLARSLEHLGRTAGRLFAVSTAGSIAGTFATAFFLIPELGTDQLIATLAVVLLAAAAAVAVAERLVVPSLVALVLGVTSLAAVASLAPEEQGRVTASQLQNWSPVYRQRGAEDRAGGPEFDQEGYDVVYTKDTRYHRVAVVDDDQSRYLRFDNSFQSGMWLDDPFRTRFAYSDYLHVGLAYKPDAKKVLVVGLGGAAVPKRVWRDFKDIEVTSVELDPEVVETAYRWFDLPRDPRIKVEVDDGRRFLQRNEEKYDVIMVDAFYSDGVPFHLTTLEFVELMRDRLTPGGVIATNVIGAITGGSSQITRALWRTYGAVFPTVELHPVYESAADRRPDDIRNIILVATERAAPSPQRLIESWNETREARAPGAPNLAKALRDRWQRDIPIADVPLLTDGYAPTDALLLG